MQDKMYRGGGMAVALLALAGCLPEGGGLAQSPGPVPQGEAPLCAPGVYGGLVGKPEAAAAAVPAPKRILGPGQMRTMDYIPARTNIQIDEAGLISRVFCG
ncbi:I78 family peptidase inhibitor [Marinovum sp.]|uniref:I78 family peptidase inhibitor n=1 Tax=Marinovum sp. TaxID=2024839 RepID=UPI002B270C96|nr:I78 family peptidase inhibitor [Marinovum sp.]